MLKYIGLAVLLATAGFVGGAQAQTSAPAVTVDQPWARATPGGAKTGAVYMTLTNHGADDQLVGASTPVAGQAQVHEMSMNNGVMKMRHISALDIKAGATVKLAPSGYHVMLLNLKQPLKEGDSFPLTLTFAKAGAEQVTVKVAKVGAMSPDGAMGNMNGNMSGMPGMGSMAK